MSLLVENKATTVSERVNGVHIFSKCVFPYCRAFEKTNCRYSPLCFVMSNPLLQP